MVKIDSINFLRRTLRNIKITIYYLHIHILVINELWKFESRKQISSFSCQLSIFSFATYSIPGYLYLMSETFPDQWLATKLLYYYVLYCRNTGWFNRRLQKTTKSLSKEVSSKPCHMNSSIVLLKNQILVALKIKKQVIFGNFIYVGRSISQPITLAVWGILTPHLYLTLW